MTFTLPLPAKLLLPLVAFGGIGAAILPADFSAAPSLKTVSAVAAQPAPSFNMPPLPAEAVHRAPSFAPASVKVEPAAWPPAWAAQATATKAGITAAATAGPADDPGLALDHVNAAVNVRAAGQKGSPVLFVLPAGAEVRIAGTQDGWVHVLTGQGEGWVYSSFVGSPRNPAPPAASTPSADGKTVQIASVVTVFDGPGGDPVYQLGARERFRILETDGKWGRIATASGEGGWVRLR